MDIQSFAGKIKQWKLKDITYSAITIFGFLIFIVIFSMTVQFLFKAINNVFQFKEEEYQITRFDLEGFKNIAGRIDIKP